MWTDYLQSLARLARQARIEDKGRLATTLTELYIANGAKMSPREVDLAFDILRALVEQIELRIRSRVAQRFADRDDVPRDLMRFLANDDISVAYPVLVRSPVLHDEDLIGVILNRTRRHWLAIAVRPGLSETVSDQLVQTRDVETVATLLGNETARLFPDTLARLVEESSRIEEYREPLLRRPDLKPELARRMYAWVGETLRDYIIEHFDMPPEAIAEAVAAAVAEETESSEHDDGRQEEPLEAETSGRTGADLVAALDEGRITAFEMLFAEILDLPLPTALTILYEGGPEKLAIACKAGGLDQPVLVRILRHVTRCRPATGSDPNTLARRALAYFGRLTFIGATTILDSWRRRPESVKRS